MTEAKGIKEVTEMELFAKSIRMTKHLLRLPIRRNMPVKHEESAVNDELIMANIARTCPDFIVMASELRLRVM
jgi:hypothetical protein